ncbi:MAG: HD domain-containing protein, partial [Erysipelotrichaceae bacterium]|nr:HD domain-containing protein [Erysipelotrichaceae bacterium]
MEKLAEKRVIRDPIHGYVHIEDKVIWDLLNTKEFQRLRRVRQLGSTLMVFPSGEHSRMMHSLGVYEVARRMINEVDDIANTLTEREKMILMVAALLHDVGHAPFSHSFESIMNCRHEAYTIQIIKGPSEIADVLSAIDRDLPAEVASVIDHTHPNTILSQLISSQLDADRLDYLLRDSYFTGVS